MTTTPSLRTSKTQAVGILALALFVIQAWVFLAADFGAAETFGGATEITAAIGYALFNLDAGSLPAEGFLVSFIIIAVVLDAALDAAVMLGKRDEDRPGVLADGGPDTSGAEDGGDD